MLSIETKIKISMDEITQLQKRLNKILIQIGEAFKGNDLSKFAGKEFIRKSFLKDELLFTEKIFRDFLPDFIEQQAKGGLYKYTYYEYDKDYLNTQLNDNPDFLKWIKTRSEKYTLNKKELFTIVFPILGQLLFNKHNLKSVNTPKTYEQLTLEKNLIARKIKDLQIEINDLYSKSLKINDYFSSFNVAQKMVRNFTFILGPTNSGKTYRAIEKLKESQSGVYLAPLRLLALEVYQRLNEEGVKCNLITGEERIIIPEAKFTSSTIEMANFNNIIETAIIDEVQLLNDGDRGYAWTNAIIGLPANNILCLGTTEIENSLASLIGHCGKNSIIEKSIQTKRLNGLEVTKNNKIEDGTAIITFSRKDVLYYAELYRKQGFNVSVIYGALSPEIRKIQINRFNNKETDIIIATDAIGLGVNLPINKIIFSAMQKYDGVSTRDLNQYEIKQISGRAGRYLSTNSPGLVSLMEDIATKNNYEKIKIGLNSYREYPSLIYFSPTLEYLQKLSLLSNQKNISTLLQMFLKIEINHPSLKMADLKTKIDIGYEVEKHAKKLDLKDKFAICFSPLEDPETIKHFSTIIEQNECKQYYHYFEKYKKNETLYELEHISKLIGLWAWFNNKYPDLFLIDNLEEFKNFRENINKKLDSMLLFNHHNRKYIIELKKNPELRNCLDYFWSAVKHDINLIKEAGNIVLEDEELKAYVLSKSPKLSTFYIHKSKNERRKNKKLFNKKF